jgi:carbamoyl-phosphate synthase small subunit
MLGKLAMEDGYVVTGQVFGAPGESWGEVVFNTSMTGYQEILTDPSYRGQIIIMTYPLIGNYGVAESDYESARPHARGLVVRQACETPSNWHLDSTLDSFLRRHRMMGLAGVDTRALVRRIRSQGTMRGVLAAGDIADATLVARARQAPQLTGQVLVPAVSVAAPVAAGHPADPKMVVVDMGSKAGIVRDLVKRGFHVWSVPWDYPAAEILAMRPLGVAFSNGPGDPLDVRPSVETMAALIGKVPILGICLGHQVLALAMGAKTYRLKFGHRGANHPVAELRSGRVYITAQNHGFAVDSDSLPADLAVTHRNLNDGTVEGLEHRSSPVFSVQYHPEASPGPLDSQYLFDRFAAMAGGKRDTSHKPAGGCL